MIHARSLVLLSSVVFALSLSACVATSSQYLQRDLEIDRIEEEQRRQMDAEPGVAELRKKFIGKEQGASLELLTNSELVTASEKSALAVYYSVKSAYQQKYTDIIRRYNPEYADIFELNRVAYTALSIDLYTQKSSFGEYNKRVVEGQAKMEEAISLRENEIATSRTNQAGVVGAAMVNYAQYLQAQQLINAQNQPARVVPFTCERRGNKTTCR